MVRKFHIGIILAIACLVLAACGSKKAVEDKSAKDASTHILDGGFAKRVASNTLEGDCFTSRMRINLRYNAQNISVTGSIRIKRGDVIQLSITPFGLVEAAKAEFTKDYVLFVDKLNKRYVKTTYDKVAFLKEAEIDFNALESMMRNELFVPGKKNTLNNVSLLSSTKASDESAVLSYSNRKLQFKFLVSLATELVQQVQIRSPKGGDDKPEFNWMYQRFEDFKGRPYPTRQKISLSGEKGMEVDLVISRMSDDSNWEKRTEVKSTFTEIPAEEMLKRIMRL